MKNNVGKSMLSKPQICPLNMSIASEFFFIFEDLKTCVIPAVLKLEKLQTLVLKYGQVYFTFTNNNLQYESKGLYKSAFIFIQCKEQDLIFKDNFVHYGVP